MTGDKPKFAQINRG